MIHFDCFGWRFDGAADWAVRDVSLRIGRGEFAAIAGPSGSGKTTLGLAMCGLLVGRYEGEAAGSVQVAGLDVPETPLHEIAQTIGLVQQNPEAQFATLRVSDEIAFGLENRCAARDEIHQQTAEAMKLLSVTHLADRSLATLSGGEKQRVAVASIVAGRPDALVLDEPTASLDPAASRDLFRVLADLCRQTGLTVVIIEHKLAQLLPLRPRLIYLEQGRVTEGCELSVPSRPTRRSAATGETAALSCRGNGASDSRCAEALVEVSGLTVELNERPILEDVTLQVSPGEVVAVMGPNGGGKSTLLHCLLALVRPKCGLIRVCGMGVPQTPVSRLARHVGMVFQNADHQLVADSVRSEALFAARSLKLGAPAKQDEADRLLDRAGLLDRAADHPYRLSWGQKRRLNLISAVLHDPRLLLLDEPFAGQDWENVGLLLDVIDAVVRGPASPGGCLMVTHDPRIIVRSCTRVVFISDGRISVDAPVDAAFDQLASAGHDAYLPQAGP